MVRKMLYVSVAVCLLLVGVMPVGVAMAQRPQPPQPDAGRLEAPPQMDFASLPATVQKAVQLQKSLSPSQQAAVRQVLDRYSAELKAFASADLASQSSVVALQRNKPAIKQPDAKQPDVKQISKDQAAHLTDVLGKIDADMAAILSADQLALYRAVIKPDVARPMANELPKLAGPDMVTKPDSASSPQSYTSYCYYAAVYDAYARYYFYWAYIYAYYNYVTYGTTYGYYGYYYAYYAYLYDLYAIDYAASLDFSWYWSGYYTSGYPYNSYYWSYYAELYSYYVAVYESTDYSNTGHAYAYYAYYYAYYANYYSSYGEAYAYYCYYYS